MDAVRSSTISMKQGVARCFGLKKQYLIRIEKQFNKVTKQREASSLTNTGWK